VASVTIPSVPSLPSISCSSLGPVAERGTALERTILPSGRTASSPATRSSILPYLVENCPAALWAIHPPTVEEGRDWGRCPPV
jgi:hypothetical protein